MWSRILISMIGEGFKVGDKLAHSVRRGAGVDDGLELVGHCSVVLRDEYGEVKDRREIGNLVVSAGRDTIIERLDSAPATSQPTHMAIGTGAVAPAAGNTTLGTELDRNALTRTRRRAVY